MDMGKTEFYNLQSNCFEDILLDAAWSDFFF